MILDVGCGTVPKGQVNVDLYPQLTPHRTAGFGTINPHKVPNFIRADIHHLPFKDNTFEKVTCYHLLEHQDVHFTEAMFELLRVSKYEIEVQVPHRYARETWLHWSQSPAHNKIFSRKTVASWIKKHNVKVYSLDTKYRVYPHAILPLIRIPWRIMITIVKEHV